MSSPGSSTNTNPSQDPANDGSMGGMLREVMSKFLQNTDDMLPCSVMAVDALRQYAQVKPLIKVQGTDGTLTSRAMVAKVPIFTLGAGGFVVSFPVNAGDIGWIKASDRDISLYLQANAEAGPNTNRQHSFSDGVFFPDMARNYTLVTDESQSVVLQSKDGTSYVAVGTDHITIKNPTLVTVDCPTVHYTGNVNVDGNVVAQGTVTGTEDVVFAGISGKGHVHPGVTTGDDPTKKPTNG